MKNLRPWAVVAFILVSAGAALAARDVVRDVVVLPLAYLLWQVRGLLAGVAQLLQWAILVSVLALVMAWQLVPNLRQRRGGAGGTRVTLGQVEAAAIGVLNARSGSYFKWQLAHRLGKIARRLAEFSGREADVSQPSPIVGEYLAAGVDHSFVEFPTRPYLFGRATSTPLDIDPGEALAYLEAQCLPDKAALEEHR